MHRSKNLELKVFKAVHSNVHARTHINAHASAHLHICTKISMLTCRCMCVQVHKHVQIRAFEHVCMHTITAQFLASASFVLL